VSGGQVPVSDVTTYWCLPSWQMQPIPGLLNRRRVPRTNSFSGVACPRIAADEQHYVFGYVRDLSDLFLVEHLK